MLTVEHVTKCYGKFAALEDISLQFTSGVYGRSEEHTSELQSR